jgi:tetratricopeptide (TPR) repeat protein
VKRALVLVVLVACGGAREPEPSRIVIAAPRPDAGVPAAPAPASQPPAVATRADAAAHWKAGQDAYDLGQYDVAIEEFKRGYELQPEPAFLYNIAQAYRRLGQAKEALFFYKRYLGLDPDSKARAQVEAWIVELEAALAKSPEERPIDY